MTLCITCKNEVIESQEYPRIKTLEVTNITNEGATFTAEVLSSGTNPINEYGFVWDSVANPGYDYSEKIEQKKLIKKGKFNSRTTASLIKDQTYFVKAYVKTPDYMVIGKQVSFISNGSIPPEILSFEPTNINWGDTVKIKGNRFSKKNNNVFLGKIKGEVIFNSDTVLKVIVPSVENKDQVKIIIKTRDNTVSSTNDLNYKKISINDFSPKNGTFGDEVCIMASNFIINESLKVTINGFDIPIIEASNEEIKIQIPDNINQKEIQLCVSVNATTACSKQTFSINPPIIKNISELEVQTGQTIMIYGENFSTINEYNIVQIGTHSVSPISSTPTSLKITIPEGIYGSREAIVQVYTAEQKHTYNTPIYIKDKWLRKGNIPHHNHSTSAVYNFSHQQYGYCALTSNNTVVMYQYDPSNDTWKNLGKFPGVYRSKMISFTIGDFAYIGGFQDFWKYDILNNKWEQITKFPITTIGTTSFAANGAGYVVCTIETVNNFWKYDPDTDTWEKLIDFKSHMPWGDLYADICFSHANKGYILTIDRGSATDQLWEYDTILNSWKRLADQIDDQFSRGRSIFVIGNEAYLLPDAYYPYYCKYEISTNTWSVEERIQGRYESICFTIDNVAYIGGGHNYENAFSDFWEYNPNL